MGTHRQSTAASVTLAGMMVRRPQRQLRAKPRRGIRFLRSWRKFRGLSQEELAARVKLTQGMISQLESGLSDYTGSHLDALARELDCEPSDLLTHDPLKGESPYSLIERMDAEDRARALEVLKALRRTPS